MLLEFRLINGQYKKLSMFVRNKYYLNDEFKQSLFEGTVSNEKELFKLPIGKQVASEPGQDVRFFRATYKGKLTGFYLKQYIARPKAIRRFFLKGIVTLLPTTREAKMTEILAKHGLPVAHIVGWGEQLLFGKLGIRGFMISQEIIGDEAVALFQEGDKNLRGRILYAVGNIMAKLAETGSYYAPRLRDFICTSDNGQEVKLSMIDQEVRIPKLRPFSEEAAYECISDAYWKMIANDLPLNAFEFRAFINGFVDGLSGQWKPSKREALCGALKGTYPLMKRVKQTARQVAGSNFDEMMKKRGLQK